MATGHLSTWTFGTSGYTLDVISIDPSEETLEAIKVSHLGQTLSGVSAEPYELYEPGDLVEGGEYTLELADDHDTEIAIDRTVETMTWTKPLQSGDTTAADWEFDGFIIGVKHNTQATNERATITVKIKVAGEITKTAAT